jgi:hypothetical protein
MMINKPELMASKTSELDNISMACDRIIIKMSPEKVADRTAVTIFFVSDLSANVANE